MLELYIIREESFIQQKKGGDKMLFTYKQIANLNETETFIYRYVMKHIKVVTNMSVRDLA